MGPAPENRPDDLGRVPRGAARAMAHGAATALAVIVVVAMVALLCDVYGAFAEGRALHFDGSALRTLLASAGLEDTPPSR